VAEISADFSLFFSENEYEKVLLDQEGARYTMIIFILLFSENFKSTGKAYATPASSQNLV